MSAIPGEIGAGVTFRVTVSFPVYPAPEWSVDLILRGPGQIDLASVADGENHAFHAPASATKNWVPGHYRFELRVSDGVDVVTVETGETRIAPDLASQAVGFDGRDHVRKVLDAVEAVIENRATIDQQSYQINNRSLQRTPMNELLRLRDRYKAELRRQRQGGRSGGLGPQIKVRFS